jgi:hypothetical protein
MDTDEHRCCWPDSSSSAPGSRSPNGERIASVERHASRLFLSVSICVHLWLHCMVTAKIPDRLPTTTGPIRHQSASCAPGPNQPPDSGYRALFKHRSARERQKEDATTKKTRVARRDKGKAHPLLAQAKSNSGPGIKLSPVSRLGPAPSPRTGEKPCPNHP